MQYYNVAKMRDVMDSILNDKEMQEYSLLLLQENCHTYKQKTSLLHQSWTAIESTLITERPSRAAINPRDKSLRHLTTNTNSTPLQERITPCTVYITLSCFNGKYYGPTCINTLCTSPPLQLMHALYVAYCQTAHSEPPRQYPTTPPLIVLVAPV